MTYDLIVRNGTVVDGTGAPRFAADVAVAGGRIAAIGTIEGRAAREIDAAGRVVCPGFVDPHTHYDAQITWDRLLSSSAEHGITTVVMGNCYATFAEDEEALLTFVLDASARPVTWLSLHNLVEKANAIAEILERHFRCRGQRRTPVRRRQGHRRAAGKSTEVPLKRGDGPGQPAGAVFRSGG
jgi:dihydroorotase-like cyclic amidohydrolase